MSGTRLIILSPERGQPSSYLIVDGKGSIAGRGQLAPGDAAPPPMRTLLVVPGTEVAVHWIELPACTPAQAVAAAGLLLKDEIAVARERVHIALGAPEADGFRPVCVADRAVMQSFLDRAAEFGIVPDAIVPDCMTIESPEDDSAVAAICGDIVVVRGKRMAFSLEPELAWLLVGKRAIRAIERADDVERLYAASASRAPVDLLQHEFARQRAGWLRLRDFRRAGALAAALLLSPLLLWMAEFAAGHLSARALEARATTRAQAVPGAANAADPVLHVRGRLADLEANRRFFAMTAALFDAVGRLNGAELESLSYLREGGIRAMLVHAGAPEAESLARLLDGSRIAFEQEPATGRRGQPAITVTLRPSP